MIYVMQRLLVLEDLQSQATHDPLTGLLNRRPMETVLENLCHSGNRQQAVIIILIDIDHFKVINDTFGHLVGDQVLKNLSRAPRLIEYPGNCSLKKEHSETEMTLPSHCVSCDSNESISVALWLQLERFNSGQVFVFSRR